ncbi:MAG: NAD-dependent DNA ligase LigA [Pseudomonadota bacterium]
MDFRHDPKTDFEPIEDLGKDRAKAEIEALRDGIAYHDHRYYVDNDPVISDAVYDQLFRRLVDLEEAFPELRSDTSPTRRVGAPPLDELERVEHDAPMLSLEAVFERAEVEAFVERIGGRSGLVLEPKFDGLSVELIYEQGRYVRAATRGDGRKGDDITANVATIGALPLELRHPDEAPERLALRGEVLLGRTAFQRLNRGRVERGEDPFANPRNAAAGTVRRLDSKDVADVPLDLVVYGILARSGEHAGAHWDDLRQIERFGFEVDPHNRRADDLDDIVAFRERLMEGRDDLEWEIDGIVVKVDDLGLRQDLGTRTRTPRWAIAWKFPPREEVTTLRDIVVQVGPTGMLTPVALLDPVDVGGVTVSRATLHNADEVARKDVRPGDRVRIERAGDVIPEIVERVSQPGKKRGPAFAMPEQCPACGAEVVREGAYTLCPAGLACPAQLRGRLVHFAGREAMDIDGLGERTAAQLVEQDLVHDLADLYILEVDDLQTLEGFGETSAKALHDAIRGSLKPPLDRLLVALGIRHVGARAARLLARRFGDLDALAGASLDELRAMSGIGEVTAESVYEFFADAANAAVLNRLREAGLAPRSPDVAEVSDALAGLTFVFTGRLEHFTRKEAEAEVERRGGRASGSVSGETDVVVVGEDPGRKLDDAEEHGATILDEAAFLEKLDPS